MNESSDEQAMSSSTAKVVAEADADDISLLADFFDFLKHNKKWWLIPLLLSLAVIGLLATVGGSALGPFIYPMV